MAGRTGRRETAASMIQNGELSGKVGLGPGPAHRNGPPVVSSREPRAWLISRQQINGDRRSVKGTVIALNEASESSSIVEWVRKQLKD